MLKCSIYIQGGGAVMRKLLLVMISCILICCFAYRFGGAKWEDAKTTAMEKLYLGVSELMFPQLHVYEYDKKTLLYNDVEQILMPVVSGFRNDITKASSNGSSELLGQDDFNTLEVQNENNTVGAEIIQDVQTGQNTQMEQDIQSSQPVPLEEVTAQVQSPSATDVTLQKQVEINRTKLQEFDYLRQNFYQVDNATTIGSDQLDVNKLLGKSMVLSEYADGPQVLIYHTHSQEAYADSIPGDAGTSVMALGAELARLLSEQHGIAVMHHTGQYDVASRNNAYANALPELEQILRENPSIEVVIDLHRDGVPATTHLVTELNGKPTAQIMFFNGLSRTTSQGDLAYLANPHIEDNLAFSFQTQLAAAEYYPGFTRRIYLKGYRYNMHLVPKSMLIEVGAQTNTFAEAKNAMEPLANILAMVLKGTAN